MIKQLKKNARFYSYLLLLYLVFSKPGYGLSFTSDDGSGRTGLYLGDNQGQEVKQSMKYASLFHRNLINVPHSKFAARARYYLYLIRVIKGYYVDRNLLRNTSLLEKVVDFAKSDLRKIDFTKKPNDQYSFRIGEVKILFGKYLSDKDLSILLAVLSYYSQKRSSSHNPRMRRIKKGRKFIADQLIKVLDIHSELLSEEEYTHLKNGTKGIFGGLGVVVTLSSDSVLTVLKPIPGSPAYKAGIKKGDKIIAIDGKSTFSLPFSQIIHIMKNKPGTVVSLKVLSQNSLNSRTLVLKREVIYVDSVDKTFVRYGQKTFLHLVIETFASRTSLEVKKAILDAKRDHPHLAGIILDLRQNPGGLLNQAVKVSDLFLDEGLIVKIKGKLKDTKYAVQGKIWDGPLAILIDEGTASASEIVTAALQDNDKAITIGVPSYGKATVQTLFELPTKEALKLTIARYYPPNGFSLDHHGVMPDLMVHPLFVRKDNNNLLGSQRYRNNKLVGENILTQGQSPIEKRRLPLFHLYFLSGDKQHSQNFLLQLSSFILDKMQSSWAEKGKRRDLMFKNKFINHRLEFLNSKISYRLKKLHKIKWKQDFYTKTARDLSLEVIHDVEDEHNFVQGKNISLDYQIRNFENLDAERVSIFVKEEKSGLLLKETLLGKINSDGLKEGRVSFPLPNILGKKTGFCDLKVGLAIDGIPVLNTLTPYTIKVQPFQGVNLHTSINLKESEGLVDGKIEANEKAFVRLKVTNQSPNNAEDITLKFVNLSGKQISLGNVPAKISHLGPWESRDIHISIKGSRKLLDSKLPFGVYLDSQNLDRPVRKEVSLYSVPNGKNQSSSFR